MYSIAHMPKLTATEKVATIAAVAPGNHIHALFWVFSTCGAVLLLKVAPLQVQQAIEDPAAQATL